MINKKKESKRTSTSRLLIVYTMLFAIIILWGQRANTQNLGIGVANPTEKLDLSGAIKIGDAVNGTPGDGTLRYTSGNGFEGRHGGVWTTLTGGSSLWNSSGSNTYYNTGNVGIGTATPIEKLEVNGAIKVANTTSVCNASTAGTIRWTGTLFQACNGISWRTLHLSPTYASGLIHYFDMSGTSATSDAIGSATATLYGVTSATAKVGLGWDRGTSANNGVKLSNIQNLSTFTVSFWWKPTDMTIHSSADGAIIMSLTASAVDKIIGMNGIDATNALRWGNFPNSLSSYANVSLSQNTWHHIVMTVSNNTTAKLYFQGNLVASLSSYNFSLGPEVWLANYSLHGGNTNNHFGRGVFDEWMAWNRVLSATEILALFNDQLSGQTNL